MRTYKFDEIKAQLPAGPWIEEPDKAVWVDAATALSCMIVRNSSGALCGYVGIPNTHEHYGVTHDELYNLSCHGGLTFSSKCQEGVRECDRAVCHTPVEANEEEEDVWWLGFDCGHYGDLLPAHRGWGSYRVGAYRSFDYVKQEVEDLAKQLTSL
jgi:hypothetical protein